MTAVDIVCPSGIYAITNKANGKRYVGSAVNIKSRWKTHQSCLNRGKHHSPKLQNSWLKNGEDAFSFDVLEYVPDREMLIQCEQAWIDCFKSATLGYNVAPKAGSCLGVRHSDEVKLARSKALKGRKRTEKEIESLNAAIQARSPEVERERIRKVSLANRNRTPEAKAESAARAVETKRLRGNLKSTPEAIAKQKAAITGRKMSPEVVAKMVGRKQSPETIEKRVSKLRGKPMPDHVKQAIRAGNLGKKHTDEHVERNRQARLGAKQSDETKAKRAETFNATIKTRRESKVYEVVEKSCTKCGAIFTWRQCKECAKVSAAKYYAANAERFKAIRQQAA